jgi:hypothetical protein
MADKLSVAKPKVETKVIPDPDTLNYQEQVLLEYRAL